MDANFDVAVALVFEIEGGYVDNPLDPGGATNMGITLATLTAWRGSAVSKAEVQALTKDEATAIYGGFYWNATHCSLLPAGLDVLVFDGAVNLGQGRSAKQLQKVVGTEQDGSIGPLTRAAAEKVNVLMGIEALVTVRTEFYKSLPAFPTFGKGWLNRTATVRALALGLAGGQVIT
jgi:lysozyme family protein